MVNDQEAIELIKKSNPDLIIKNINFIRSGFHSLAILINNNYIFRFPLKRDFFSEYIKEEKLLRSIYDEISTQIPLLTLYKINEEIFTRHLFIKGEQYNIIINNLNNYNKKRIAKDIAKFMSELHSIQINNIETLQFSLNEYNILEYKSILYNYLQNDENIKKFNDIINEFNIESNRIGDKDIVLCHNDLNENNILINKNTKRLSGIIDFGNAVKRNFNVEFSPLLKYDFDLVLNIVDEYQKLTGRKVNLKYAILVQKIRCYGAILWSIIEKKEYKIPTYEKWLEKLEKY